MSGHGRERGLGISVCVCGAGGVNQLSFINLSYVFTQGEVTAIEASEVYRVCATCEDAVARNIHIYEFDARVPELEAELFDLQRQIDHYLTFVSKP